MEVLRSSTGGTPSKLEQLLTTGTTIGRRSSRAEESSSATESASVPIIIASKSGPAAGPPTSDKGVDLDTQTKGKDAEDGGNSSSTSTTTGPASDKYRNPRKRHLMDALNSGGDQATREDKVPEESAKRFMKSKGKSEDSSKGNTNNSNNGGRDGPASLKVAPIRLKKYYPSAVQSAECEEFLVSLSEDKNAKNHEENPKLTTHVGVEEGSNANTAKDGKVKSKSNLEHSGPGGIDTDQIEKLLSMPSPNKSWSKTPRQRSRKQQCKKCSKSFPKVDDLQAHMLTHSQEDAEIEKPVRCMHCDKTFAHEANLEVHLKYSHKKALSQNGLADENGMVDEDKTTKKPVTTEGDKSSSESEAVYEPESDTTEVATKIPTTKIPLTKIKVKPVKTSAIKKKLTTITKANSKSKKEDSSTKTDVDQETPTTPTSGRTALRRNIQRPKWLSDTDLVTDYEFPRGTNTMRGNSIPSSPSASSSASSIVTSAKTSRTETRRSTSVEAANEKPSTPTAETKKADKPAARPSRDSKNNKKEESNMAGKNASSPKTSKVTKTKKESKGVSKGAIPATKPVPNTRRKERGQADGLPKLNSPSTSASPTKQLQDQILTLSLSTLRGENSVGKNVRKRMSTDAGVAENNLSEKAQKKVKRCDSTIVSSESESKSGTAKQYEKSSSKPQTNQLESEDGVEKEKKTKETEQRGKKSKKAGYRKRKVIIVHNPEPIRMMQPQPDCQGSFKNRHPAIPPIVLTDEVPSKINSRTSSDQPIDAPDCTKNVTVSALKSEITEYEDPDAPDKAAVDNIQACVMKDEVQGNEQLTTATSVPFANCDGVTFADIAERNSEIEASKEADLNHGDAVFDGSRQVISGSMEVVENDIEKSHLDNGAATATSTKLPDILVEPLATISNDEEMPILKPETESTIVTGPGIAVVSCPPSNQPKSIDGEETSNSTHSATPYEAPILSKESTQAQATSLEASATANTAQDELSVPANSVTDDSAAVENDFNTATPNDLDELPFDDEDNVIVRSRRDRSDSMSMRSCGSGTPSEKLQALDDTNTIVSTKEKETNILSDNECLANDSDSESNDTLMSAFSELAAQVSENTDAAKFKEDCLRFMSTKISANSMWSIRKELKLLKRNKNYFKFGKLSPLAAGLMHDIFCQSLE